jgi:hypothetical protein
VLIRFSKIKRRKDKEETYMCEGNRDAEIVGDLAPDERMIML